VNFQVTVLKILVAYPDRFAVMADLKSDMAIPATGGRDWADRTTWGAGRRHGWSGTRRVSYRSVRLAEEVPRAKAAGRDPFWASAKHACTAAFSEVT
jgi:hypothetical protein